MRVFIISILTALIACDGDPTNPTSAGDTDPGSDTDLPFGGSVGNIALVRTYQFNTLQRAELFGVFANSDQGYINAAVCADDPDTACIPVLPDIGGRASFVPVDRFIPANSFYDYVGLTIGLGRYEAPYSVGDELSGYYEDVTNQPTETGSVDIELGVEWGPYDGDDVTSIPEPLEMISPRGPNTLNVFSNDEAFPILWEAENDGDLMVILVENLDPELPATLFTAPDTGSFGLDLASLGLIGDQDLQLTVARWRVDELDVNGNALTVTNISQHRFALDYRDIGLRTPVFPRNTCNIEPPRLPLGRYFGDAGFASDDYTEVLCLSSFDAANGRDSLFTLTVPPRTRTEITYRQLNANASMYLLDDCLVSDECVLGADDNPGQGPEQLSLFNPDATETERYTLVLDAADDFTGGIFFIDHEQTPLAEIPWADTCEDAASAMPLLPGEYYAAGLDGYENALNPGFNGCTGTTTSGPDGILPVTVPAGATLQVTMSMTGADPALYLLPDCTDAATCVAGEDMPGDVEVLVYDNPSGTDLNASLVLDTKGGSGPYFLTMTFL